MRTASLSILLSLVVLVAQEVATCAAVIIPSGTKILIVMDSTVNSDTSRNGDEILARTVEEVNEDGSAVLPAGTVLKGRINLFNDQAMKPTIALELQFDTIMAPGGQSVPVVATLVCRGGVVHVRRGLRDIGIDSYPSGQPPLLSAILRTGGGRPEDRSSSTPKEEMKRAGLLLPLGTVGLVVVDGRKVDLRKGDEIKIQIAKDLQLADK
jgi:hypothetical protein